LLDFGGDGGGETGVSIILLRLREECEICDTLLLVLLMFSALTEALSLFIDGDFNSVEAGVTS